MKTETFKASELCSRKLWQLVNSPETGGTAAPELEQAILELTSRRHYLEELARIGKLGDTNHSS